MTFAPLNEQMDEIRRDTAEIIPEEELERKIARALETGTPLVVKQGFDPTRPDLHIGHAVSMRKLRTFMELGHDVVFVVGDYTARVGDPTGRSEMRPKLTPEEIDANARTYAEQAGRILDVTRVRIAFNSQWLAPLDLAKVLELTATYTVARMLERDDFAKRYQEGIAISVMEFMYPLLQAYDSVALKADVELGGSDQKFNLLVGRSVQERYGQEPQVCLIMPLLRGTDGAAKMSKSYGNYIGICETPEEQFGKTMSIPDTLLEEWFELASQLPPAELAQARQALTAQPYASKRRLAALIADAYHGAGAGDRAAQHFDKVFKSRDIPEHIPEISVSLSDPVLRYKSAEGVWVPGLLVAVGLAASNADAIRLIEQGAVEIDDRKVADRHACASIDGPLVVRKGKRHFVRVSFTRN